ncbi:MAG: metal ABC transporter permease [Deferribacteraceae bacterium]|jgi:manganese/zinc/iron transport system permease protein|nr:metal ABC transporter permease [Deferribacteraceae bacterium]
MNPRVEIIIIIFLTALVCIAPGALLLKKRITLYAGAVIASTILAIIAANALFKSTDSLPVVLGITAVSALVIFIMDKFEKASIAREHIVGILPPFIFSIALILISLFPVLSTNMDMDTILLGELVFLPLDRISFFGFDLGPIAIYQLLAVLAMNIALVALLGKEMVFSMFDPNYSMCIDHSPLRSRFVLLLAAVITAVVAFRIAGIIMIVGLIAAPAFIAALFTNRFWLLALLAGCIGAFSNFIGYAAAHILEITISATMTAALGIVFLLTALFAPIGGFWAKLARKKQGETNRAIALAAASIFENGDVRLLDGNRHLNSPLAEEYITHSEDGYTLTEKGRALAQDVIAACRVPDRL